VPFDIDSIQVIDTHERLADVFGRGTERINLVELLRANSGLMEAIRSADPQAAARRAAAPAGRRSAGIIDADAAARSEDGDSSDLDEAELDAMLFSLPAVVLTSHWKCQWIAFHDLYDFDDPMVTEENWRELEENIREAYRDGEAWQEEILRRAGIRLFFWCCGPPRPRRGCRGVLLLRDFLELEKEGTAGPDELAGRFRSWLEMEIQRYNPVAMKTEGACRRGIPLRERDEREVAAELSRIGDREPLLASPVVEDFVHDCAAEWAARHALPIQMHTDVPAGGALHGETALTYARRTEQYVARHPETIFDILQAGFPQWEEAIALCRRYPNVLLNLAGLSTLSETLSHTILETALEAVPVNKILWGGDAGTLEAAYGVLTLFRSTLERVLYIKDIPDEPKEEIAARILWKNASELYHLG
jgi:hypothetical protein